MRRVAVTGIGMVSPLGLDVSSTWRHLQDGRSGIGRIQQFDASHFPTQIAAEVKQFVPRFHDKKTRYANAFIHYALNAAGEALDDAALKVTDAIAPRMGVVVGSGMMTTSYDYFHRFQKTAAPEGTLDWARFEALGDEFYSVRDFGQSFSNTGLSTLIEVFGVRGYSTSVHTACASGGQALGLALQAIRRGDADYMLAGGFDSMICPTGLASFCLLGAMSTYNDTPETASRPFDGTRNGFVLGEGASFLILEEWSKAKARGARIYAELAGQGNTLSSYRITDSHPNGDGAKQAIAQALADANVTPKDVDYINAHGTSTKMNDLSETNAIKAVFQERAYQIPVSSTKSQTGHLIAAAGAIEASISVLAIRDGLIPPTANLTVADPDCDLDYVTEGFREKSLGVVVSNSFGFGGSNSALCFKHPDFGPGRK